jgi:hypothetical protein
MAQNNGNSVWTSPTALVDEAHNETLSPASYRDRVQAFIPQKEDPNMLENYFVSVN